MPLISTVIVSWCKKHPDGDDDGDDGYDYAPAACMEGDGDDDDDGDYDYAPAAPLEGDDDDDDGDYDYAPAVQVGKSNCCAFQDTFIINCFGEDWSSKACLSK